MWVLAALGSAIAYSLRDTLVNRHTTTSSTFLVGWTAMVTTIVMAPFFILNPSSPGTTFLLLGAGVLDAAAFGAYFYVLRHGELSLQPPLIALLPVGVAAMDYVYSGITPSLEGLVGVVLVAIGGFVLLSPTLTEPLYHLGDRPSLVMVGVVTGWSVAVPLYRIAAQSTSPMNISFVSYAVVGLLFLPFVLTNEPTDSYLKLGTVAFLGLTNALLIFVGFALIAYTSYVVAVKRVHILLTTVIGLYYGEESGTRRVTGALLLLSGALMLIMLG